MNGLLVVWAGVLATLSAALVPGAEPFVGKPYTDRDLYASTGWLGYDYIVNQEVISDSRTTVKRWREGAWHALGKATYDVDGNGLEIAVPRDVVGETDGDPAFDFHWADNIQSFEGVAELGANGDSAPNRRWNYRFGVATPGAPTTDSRAGPPSARSGAGGLSGDEDHPRI